MSQGRGNMGGGGKGWDERRPRRPQYGYNQNLVRPIGVDGPRRLEYGYNQPLVRPIGVDLPEARPRRPQYGYNQNPFMQWLMSMMGGRNRGYGYGNQGNPMARGFGSMGGNKPKMPTRRQYDIDMRLREDNQRIYPTTGGQ